MCILNVCEGEAVVLRGYISFSVKNGIRAGEGLNFRTQPPSKAIKGFSSVCFPQKCNRPTPITEMIF